METLHNCKFDAPDRSYTTSLAMVPRARSSQQHATRVHDELPDQSTSSHSRGLRPATVTLGETPTVTIFMYPILKLRLCKTICDTEYRSPVSTEMSHTQRPSLRSCSVNIDMMGSCQSIRNWRLHLSSCNNLAIDNTMQHNG